ncbi:MAG: fumarate hydratase [Kiritimatiellae bacterium]|nr:fumarate hydratase [Kiritimatiellia bacterium]
MNVVDKLVDLIRKTSSSLPEDVLKALKAAARKERKGSSAAVVLKTILENCAVAAKRGTPLCQDTGTLTFFVDERLRRKVTPAVIKKSVALATAKGYLRKNTIDSVSGKSYDDNVCEGAPVIHYTLHSSPFTLHSSPAVTLVMKGGGSENMSRQYSLPDAALGAGRDLEGVRKCILDAVQKIQGYGCAPGILGVCIGGDRATGYEVAKEQLLHPLGEPAGRIANGRMAELEKRVLEEANSLGIGPMGLGGKTTLLGVKIASRPRVPASFFVTIAYMCWACRRRTVSVEREKMTGK